MSDHEPPDVRDETGHLVRELHGVTLAAILEYLVARFGFPELGRSIPIQCFTNGPSIKSSLAFLRRTPWAEIISGRENSMLAGLRQAIGRTLAGTQLTVPLPNLPTEDEWAARVARLCNWA